LPQLVESAILEHFISVVSSRCPCLKGSRFFLSQVIFSWLLFGFWSLAWVLLSFLLFFTFLWIGYLCVLSMHSSRGRLRTRVSEDRWLAESSAGRMVARKARQSHRSEPMQGSGSQPKSAHGVCCGSPQKHRVTWLSYKTKTGDSVGGDRIRARQEASMPADAWRDRRACVGMTQTAAMAWSCDEEECCMTYFP
jgi:hypothetical protein